jgi:hypothetical protein
MLRGPSPMALRAASSKLWLPALTFVFPLLPLFHVSCPPPLSSASLPPSLVTQVPVTLTPSNAPPTRLPPTHASTALSAELTRVITVIDVSDSWNL